MLARGAERSTRGGPVSGGGAVRCGGALSPPGTGIGASPPGPAGDFVRELYPKAVSLDRHALTTPSSLDQRRTIPVERSDVATRHRIHGGTHLRRTLCEPKCAPRRLRPVMDTSPDSDRQGDSVQRTTQRSTWVGKSDLPSYIERPSGSRPGPAKKYAVAAARWSQGPRDSKTRTAGSSTPVRKPPIPQPVSTPMTFPRTNTSSKSSGVYDDSSCGRNSVGV